MDKKDLILEQAAKLFAEKGYYGLGLSELLKCCGIPKGSFYYYFPEGKIQLLQEVLAYSYACMRGWIDSWIRQQPSALAAFSHMTDVLSGGVSNGHYLSSMTLSMIAIESVYLDERVNQTCRAIYSDWQQFYAGHLAYFGVPEALCIQKAQAVFALIHGSLLSAWIKQDPQDLHMAKSSLQDLLSDY